LAKHLVITIHGVNPNRLWQERVRKVLDPHFDCRSLTYYQYDTILGPLRAVVNTTALLISVGLVVAAVLQWHLGNMMFGAELVAPGFIVFLLGVTLARHMRMRSVESIKQLVDKTPYTRPHVIAHSLGTYLVGTMLKKFLDIRLGNVVLVSSVLPETYPWESLLKNRPDCVLNVRNEFGTMDNVTKLVAKLQWLVGDLGASGAVGFNGDAAVIHTSKQPMADCGSAVKVHNVPLEGYEHSTQLLGAGHAARVWLPFLWGLSPDEFWRYLEAC
jgi:pimeloyl-ACP methyl ester carboxylesterase